MTDPVLSDAADAALAAVAEARRRHDRWALAEIVRDGADATPTGRLDGLVEAAVLDRTAPYGVNVLSEEIGFVDRGSARTLVIDPVDGTGNAVTGLPFAAFTGALVEEATVVEALTVWIDTGRVWHARVGERRGATSGVTALGRALVSTIRPKESSARRWGRLVGAADRLRILGSSSLECALVAQGSVDAFVDPGSDTHRLVDLVAAQVLVPAAGGVLVDLFDRPIVFDVDLTRRYSGLAAATPALADELRTLLTSQT